MQFALQQRTVVGMAEKSGLSLSLSLSLSPPGGGHQSRLMQKKKNTDDGNEVSLELTLSTPSCHHNVATRLPRLPPPLPMEAVEPSDGSRCTLLLDLTLSLPRDGPTASSDVTPNSSTETWTEVDSAPANPSLPPLVEKEATPVEAKIPQGEEEVESKKRKASEEDVEEGSGTHANGINSLPASKKPNTGELQARRGTWQEKAQLLMGTKPLRVLEKRLFSTDVSRGHARFLFTEAKEDKGKPKETEERGPRKLLNMLTPAEKAAARDDGGGLPVMLLNRWGEDHPGNKLRFWNLGRSFVLMGKWPEFARLNELEAGDVIEVYAFRVPQKAAAPTTAGPSSPEAQAVAASAEEGVGGPQAESRLAVVVCSRVPLEEEERRRRETPEAKEARRQQQKVSTASKRKRGSLDRQEFTRL